MKLTRKEAIDKNCFECMLYEEHEPGTHRQQIERCHLTDCPFYEYRPIPNRRDKDDG